MLSAAGIQNAVPRIYDIFQYAGEIRFSMDHIRGVSAFEKLKASSKPDIIFLQILAQASLALALLEEKLRLDHRDLKADNIWIRDTPIEYTLALGGSTWHISCPFQVVLLDFGFACIGGEDGTAVINLSDGILPKVDPCPKVGRDLFQFISSLWPVLDKVSPPLKKEFELLLSYKGHDLSSFLSEAIKTHWVYLIVSDPKFAHAPLHPLSLLHLLSIKYSDIGLVRK
jgi:serine/threonine protein kinase